MEETFLDDFAQQNHTSNYQSESGHDAEDDEGKEGLDGNDGDDVPEHELEKGSGRGKATGNPLSEEQRKEKQRNQNRKAAERSRNRKREELTTLEMTVNNIQDENQQLRLRLAALLASKSSPKQQKGPVELEANTANPSPSLDPPAGLDFSHLAKLQSDLTDAKQSLLAKEALLARRRDGDAAHELDERRRTLLSHQTKLTMLQAEVKSLHAVLGHLRTDKDTLVRRKEILSREIEGRKSLAEATNDVDVSSGKLAGAERALLELRNWLDGAIKTWDQTSLLPVPDRATR